MVVVEGILKLYCENLIKQKKSNTYIMNAGICMHYYVAKLHK